MKASLSLADLESSLSRDLTSRISEQRRPADWNRIERTLVDGQPMVEYPIGADGSERGVMQFIGPNEGMPHFAVEVRQAIIEPPPDVQRQVDRTSQSQTAPPAISEPPDVDTSPKTGLNSSPSSMLSELESSVANAGDMLSSATPTETASTPSQTRDCSISRSISSPKIRPLPSNALAQAQDQETRPKALTLHIEVGMAVYQNTPDPKLATDAKIEVWMNGCLVHVSFIARIRSGSVCVLHFAGTRMRQQAEKPWIYQSVDHAAPRVLTAQQRWEAVGSLLAEQVTARGIDKLGNAQPSAEYLAALAQSPLPTRLKDQHSLGIVDVVVTTGLGRKTKDVWGTNVAPMGSTLHKMRATNDQDTTARESEHAPQTDTKEVSHTNHSPSRAPSKKQKLDSTPPKAAWIDVNRRSKRKAGVLVHLDPDHFLKTPGQDVLPASSPQKVSRGGRGKESTVTDAPEAFKSPKLCKACVIGYSEPDIYRSIPQTRPAQFDENGLTVGFRFVVV